ncbi:hypothetical protein [Kineococcus rhizosphaerae]|uniref:Uncharacterized protein n=1 Tax=Kineococcus rhizosphaerae TaxID=559628 RepID=A0A2T0R8B0_9ACTN|nr:hypothetical protein [Kineococcus rhizosphaerae]PRY17354.1 hypothetical protein CLV37_102315 [Kineococcus rhizosphaerae]
MTTRTPTATDRPSTATTATTTPRVGNAATAVLPPRPQTSRGRLLETLRARASR